MKTGPEPIEEVPTLGTTRLSTMQPTPIVEELRNATFWLSGNGMAHVTRGRLYSRKVNGSPLRGTLIVLNLRTG